MAEFLHPAPRLGRRAVLGFTLLEMSLVVTVLAALGGAAIYAASESRDRALQQLSLVEMQEIKRALLQYKQDVGTLPQPDHPADFSLLYAKGTTQAAWDAATGRGWRGPYLSRSGEGWVDVGDGLQSDGSGSPAVVAASSLSVQSVADPFPAAPAMAMASSASGTYASCDESIDNTPASTGLCLLDWRVADGQPTHTRWGRPYLLFDMNDMSRARIVSMGLNGVYDSAPSPSANVCLAKKDDVVLCIQ